MYAPQPPPPSQPESTWPRVRPVVPAPPTYLPQPMSPLAAGAREEQALHRWVRIPLERPVVTPVLLAAIAGVYAIMALSPQIDQAFKAWGASFKVYPVNGELHGLLYGEWWRLITATFLHGFFLHILLNGYALYVIGMELEALVGKARFAAIYAVSGLAGSVASFTFSPANVPGVGASGAIFGLIGALAVYSALHRRLLGRTGNIMFWNMIIVIVINLGIGFLPFSLFGKYTIDNSAHIGGLVGGFAIGFVLCPRYGLGDWLNPQVRNLVNVNRGRLPWLAAALLGLIVVLIFVTLYLMFQQGIIKPTYVFA